MTNHTRISDYQGDWYKLNRFIPNHVSCFSWCSSYFHNESFLMLLQRYSVAVVFSIRCHVTIVLQWNLPDILWIFIWIKLFTDTMHWANVIFVFLVNLPMVVIKDPLQLYIQMCGIYTSQLIVIFLFKVSCIFSKRCSVSWNGHVSVHLTCLILHLVDFSIFLLM